MNPANIDLDIGIGIYTSHSKGFIGYLRRFYKDFIVDEIGKNGIPASVMASLGRPSLLNGKYQCGVLIKEGVSTLDCIQTISKKAGVSPKLLFYAGLKDVKSLSYQYLAIKTGRSLYHLKFNRCKFLPIYRSDNPITVGWNRGNIFTIRIRDVSQTFDKVRLVSEFKDSLLPNFYGYQRFGYRKPYNHEIGKLLLKHQFSSALQLLIDRYHVYFKNLKDMDLRDPIKYLRRIPYKILKLILQSYQSYIFNLYLTKRIILYGSLEKSLSGEKVWVIEDPLNSKLRKTVPVAPLVGYRYKDFSSDCGKLIYKIMKEEDILPRDFIIKQFPELSLAGGFREISMVPWRLETKAVEDGSIIVRFTLNRGCYASIFIREVMKPYDPVKIGLI